jgi:hypothetical protein
VLDAVELIMANRHLNRENVHEQLNGKPLNLSFASESWLRVIGDRHRPGQLLRRHVEVCVFSHLADASANYLAPPSRPT